MNAIRGITIEKERAFAVGALVEGRCRGEGGGRSGREDVIDVETKMVKAGTVLFEPVLQRVIWRQRLHQLKVRITQIEMGQPDGAVIDVFTVEQGEPHLIAPQLKGSLGVGHGDGEMIEAVVS